ncbi:MAG: hypothetical protein H0W83_08245 [Planctomycetes bacterium]|nr:hypothetical protein [Planctomycetota bacterium]
MTTSGTLTEFPVPTVSSNLSGIVAGPDGALWFSEYSGNKIGRITTAGAITEYPLLAAASGPSDLTVGPDNTSIWFTEETAFAIGKIDLVAAGFLTGGGSTTGTGTTGAPAPSGGGGGCGLGGGAALGALSLLIARRRR